MISKFKKTIKYSQHERVTTTRKNKLNPSSTYTTHHILDLKDLAMFREKLKTVWEVYCMRKPTKMMVMYSYLTETEHRNADGTITYTHEIVEATVYMFHHKAHLPIVVHNSETLDIFVEYALKQLQDLLERTQKDTKTHIITILEAFVACYDLSELLYVLCADVV
jgi:hypothetical protein